VLDTLRYIKHKTRTWLEITTLLIPGQNDSESEIEQLCRFVENELGPEVPLHFTAFHPDFKLDGAPTPPATLQRARAQALALGLKHVYTGNVHDPAGQSTYCAGCRAPLIDRDGYDIGKLRLQQGACPTCRKALAGRFAEQPGQWGNRRRRLRIAS
jgi:pyruvate formate lyase activating enzyme